MLRSFPPPPPMYVAMYMLRCYDPYDYLYDYLNDYLFDYLFNYLFDYLVDYLDESDVLHSYSIV